MKHNSMRSLFQKVILLALVFSTTLVAVFALVGETATYPFKKGEDSLLNGVTWTGPEAQTADQWQFLEVKFDQGVVDFRDVEYLAVQYRADKGSPGLTFGLLEKGDRFATAGVPDDQKEIFFLNEDGSIDSLGKVMYGAVWIPEGKRGSILIPMTSLGWQWNNSASDLSTVSAFYITTNSLHNFGWEFSIGELGYYKQSPATGGELTKLLDLSQHSKLNKYYYDSQAVTSLSVIGTEYPYGTSESAFNGGVTWTSTETTASENDNWLSLFFNFAEVTNLSNAKYFVVHYRADRGTPGLTWGIEAGTDRFSTQVDGKDVFLMNTSGKIVPLTKVQYSSISIERGQEGIIILPMDAIVHQFGPNANGLDEAKNFLLTTNSKYNYDWSVTIGEIGYLNGDLGDDNTVFTPINIEYFHNGSPDVTTALEVDVNDYPLSTDEQAFNGGRLWIASPTASVDDVWETLFVNFKYPVDLTDQAFLAVQFRADEGTPGLTFAVQSNNTRYALNVDGDSALFMNQRGLINALPNVLYGALNIDQGKTGLLLIPIENLKYQFGDAGDTLATVDNFLVTTNSKYNYNFAISISQVGLYNLEPGSEGSVYTPIEIDNYFNAGPNMISEFIDVQEWSIADETDYPLRTGENAYLNGKIWVSPSTGSEVDDIQKLSIKLDGSTVDLSTAKYIGIQIENPLGAPGLTFALKSGDSLFTLEKVEDGSKFYYLKEDGKISSAGTVLYSAITTNLSSGMLLIPIEAFGWNNSNGNLSSISDLVISTNRKYNYNFHFKVGEIGYYNGEIEEGGTEFIKILDLTSPKNDRFVLSGQITNQSSLIETNERTVYGDTIVNFTATGKSPENFGIWSGGSLGLVSMAVDSYGDSAIKVKATGTNPTGDAYTAIDILQTGGFTWADHLGVSFWARNDSEGEISFNIEVDNKITESGIQDRFNIKQGNRYYLYDVNTNKISIYTTKPTATLPVGFEGWVRIPFTAFNRADWSNNGVTKDKFMKEGTIVTYLAITIHSTTYLNMEFSLNKFGAYSVDPSFISDYVTPNNTRKTLLELMDLERLGG